MRIGFSGPALAFLASAVLFSGAAERAGAEGGAPAAPASAPASGGLAPAATGAPQMGDYQGATPLPVPSTAPGVPPLDLSIQPTQNTVPTPASGINGEADKNWLQKGVDAERKANEARQAQDNPLSPGAISGTPGAPKVETRPDAASAKTDAKKPGTLDPLVPAAPKAVDTNQLKPALSGLSAEATKPLGSADSNRLDNNNGKASGISGLTDIKPISPINSDMARPNYLDSSSAAAQALSSTASGTAPYSIGSTAVKMPAGYEIPNAPTLQPASLAPASLAAPAAPVAPQADRPSALSPFAPIDTIRAPTIPVAPVAPQAPTALQSAPKAGSSAIRVKDPSQEQPFFR